ncbi:ATP-dependent endonuclease [Nitrosospira lacus]|uniref:ATP-dependent endonuclease n=1 Tax=Nitrosospira lacus TaxID=1288494 RepID=A0A1W6SR67_9PROT|nr:AAA family ATPase [Nitrosospira lacus]ARO88281.1 ATP-dependent endonuclease [Nitrosospira lacus]
MKFEEIHILNFKGIKEGTFRATDFSCLVGENNAGKSSVLQAIVIGLTRPTTLASTLFYDQAVPVELTLRFSAISNDHLKRLAQEHRSKIEEIIYEGTLILIVRYKFGQKVEVKVLRKTPINENYRKACIDGLLKGKKGVELKEIFQKTYPELLELVPIDLTISKAKTYLDECISKLDSSHFALDEAPLPSGISSSITALLPEAIYIPAVKNLTDDLKTSQTTSFGRLLGLLLEEMTPDLGSINESLKRLNEIFNKVIADDKVIDNRHQNVKDLENLVEGFLSENFPRVKLELCIPPPELKTILHTAQIFVNDGAHDLIDNKGDGIKRSLTFSLLRAYVHQLSKKERQEEDPAEHPLIFLFEEPELYLHPKSQKVLFGTLATISKSHQVVVTTHSPFFFAPGVTANFVRVAKIEDSPKSICLLYDVNFKLDAGSAEVFKLAKFENADAAFFSTQVVLFEGESDDSFSKHLAKLINPSWDFEQKSIALVKVSGKGNFSRYRGFFEKFGIRVKIVADLDVIFNGYHHLGATPGVTEIKNAAVRNIDERIKAADLRCEPTTSQVKDKVNQDSWHQKYILAKTILRKMQETQLIDKKALDELDELFDWESESARVAACKQDPLAASALLPLLDSLKEEGIYIFSRGAIEDYYPNTVPKKGTKPERAILAASLIKTKADVLGLSMPLANGRSPELVEIFEHIFQGL